MPEQQFNISDLAGEFQVTTRAIRFYEEKGLLAPTRVGLQRIYKPSDRVRLKLILRGKRLGLSLNECRELLDMYDPAHGNVDQLRRLMEKIDDKEAQLQRQLRDIAGTRKDLEDVRQRCQQALQAHLAKADKVGASTQ
jgi:DNA-binding transcriptional MerR regulator